MENRKKVADLKREHRTWRDSNFQNRVGFFAVFQDFKYVMKNLSPGATTLFLYLGLHSNNLTGEVTHTIDRMAKYFNKSTRTISMWLKELEENHLIERIQITFNGPSHTFILPYFKSKENGKEENIEDDLPF